MRNREHARTRSVPARSRAYLGADGQGRTAGVGELTADHGRTRERAQEIRKIRREETMRRLGGDGGWRVAERRFFVQLERQIGAW